jgi:hypothetical protein
MMNAVSSSETPVLISATRRRIPQDGILQTEFSLQFHILYCKMYIIISVMSVPVSPLTPQSHTQTKDTHFSFDQKNNSIVVKDPLTGPTALRWSVHGSPQHTAPRTEQGVAGCLHTSLQ